MNTPADLLNAVFEAMNIEDWKTLGDLCDPVGLRLFKKELLEIADAPPRVRSLDDDDDSDDEAWKQGSASEAEDFLKRELYNVSTLEEVQAMDPAKLFARWVQGKAQRQYRAFGDMDELKSPSEPMHLSHSFTYVVLGSIPDTDGIAYAMYRNDRDVPPAPRRGTDDDDLDPPDEEELDRILCVRSFVEAAICRQQPDGSWRLIPRHSLYLVPTMQIPKFG